MGVLNGLVGDRLKIDENSDFLEDSMGFNWDLMGLNDLRISMGN